MRLALLFVLASIGGSSSLRALSSKCPNRSKACLSWLQASSGHILATYLAPSGGTVDTTGVTFARNSAGAACTDASGDITFPATNVPCANSTGLYVRGAIGNVLTYSDDFANAAWTAVNVTVTADSTVAPDGTTTADTLATTSAGGYVYQAVTSTGRAATFSLYVRTDSTQAHAVEIYDATTSTSLGLENCTAGSGWPAHPWIGGGPSDRCGVSVTATTSGDSIQFRIYPGGASGTGTTYAWGAQAEWSPYANDYCPSGATPTTCAAESAQVSPPTAFSPTSGCAEVCLTPSWTGTIPGTAGTQLAYFESSGSNRLLYSIQTLSTVRAYDGLHTPEVSGGFVAGMHKCYATRWDSSARTLAVENLSTGTTSSLTGFTGFVFQPAFAIGSTSPSAGIDTIKLGSSAEACK